MQNQERQYMKKHFLLPMNLQFFAEGEGGDVSETGAVEQSEGTEATTEATETESEGETNVEPTEPQVQSKEANAAFASMRRELEGYKRQAAELDQLYASQFGNYTNPETGEPIRNAKDYLNAMAAQERLKAREELKANNIDPEIVDRMIANSPVVRQAEEATRELNQYRMQQQISEDLNKILALDKKFNSIEQLMSDPIMGEVAGYIEQHPGVRADEAYKIVNYDRLSSSNTAAAKQAAINSIKGKNHLATGTALNVDDTAEDIPAGQLEMYKEAFPGKPIKELKALYNKALSARKG